ncbi:MAG TPA: hypothetical protein VGR57_01350 [Ktedonobacterales bacterium]|nr:hypothetical protein [Ktedonobacterales bacterium]
MRFLRTAFKHWYLYLIPMIVIPIMATAYGFNKLTLYTSTALLYVDKPVLLSNVQTGWNPYLSYAQNEATEMQQLLSSQSFVVTAAARTDLAQRYDLSTAGGKTLAYNRITSEVSIVPLATGFNVLTLSVSDKEPHLAQQIVSVLLTYYQSYYQKHRLDIDQQALTIDQGQLATATNVVAQDDARLAEYCRQHADTCNSSNPTDPTLAQLNSQLAQDTQAESDLNSQVNTLSRDVLETSTIASHFFTVLDQPLVPAKPDLDRKKLLTTYTGGGLAAALALVALIVFIRTQLDRKVYAEDDLVTIQEDLGLALGGGIVTLPVIAGMDAPAHGHGDPDDALDGILVPVLTALPRLRAQDVKRELRKAAGVQPAALASATAEDVE